MRSDNRSQSSSAVYSHAADGNGKSVVQGSTQADATVPDSTGRYSVQLPSAEGGVLSQDEAYFHLDEGGERKRIRFHDYDEIYRRPGLYEQLFYDRLKCTSPDHLAEWLTRACSEEGESTHSLRVLDLGAGNGMMAEALYRLGVARIVGIDILEEAKEAAARDRAGIYDAYVVQDLTMPDPNVMEELRSWKFDCLTTVAALGFGDIPPKAFVNAVDLVQDGGWICFNIKETFLSDGDPSGFSSLVREFLQSGFIEIHSMVRYRHRYCMEGKPLFYYGIVGRRRGELPELTHA